MHIFTSTNFYSSEEEVSEVVSEEESVVVSSDDEVLESSVSVSLEVSESSELSLEVVGSATFVLLIASLYCLTSEP